MSAVPRPTGIPHVAHGRAWVESEAGYSAETAVASASFCFGMSAAWLACARQLDSRVRVPRPEPDWSQNWFCARCLTLMVGGRTESGVCPGCEAGAA